MTDEKDTKQATIMIIDDTPANLDLLQILLQERGYSVMAFPRGALALNAALKNPPDLIMLDINMPEMDGFEVCRRLKASDSLKHIPVLFISAVDATEEKVKAFSVGGVDYVTKPFQIDEVNARVETHIRLVRMQNELMRYNRQLEDLVQEKVKDIEESHHATILAMVKLAENRDDDTGRHIDHTRYLCKILAEKLVGNSRYSGYISDRYVVNIYNAAPLHDIGKVGIPDKILLKPGRLTADEWLIMKRHTLIGAETLQAVHTKHVRNIFINMGISIARSHHEKWDGSGYPEGLKGEDIPLSARIMAVVDVYDALRSQRPYKEAFSHEKSLEIIISGAGTHFDPDIVEAFGSLDDIIKKIFG